MTAVLDRFGDMVTGYGVAAVQVSHRTGDAQNAVAGAC